MATPATSRLLRRINAQRLLDAVRAADAPLRVTELVALTELSRPTVDAVADDLVRLGWLRETAAGTGGRGRPARVLEFCASAGYVAGLDIGERKVRVAVADLLGEIIAERVRFFEEDDRLLVTRQTASATLKDARIKRGQLLSSCVGCTGPMNPTTGRVLFSDIFPENFDLAGAMARTLGRPIVVENDCNAAVIAERWCGAAAGLDDIVCVLAAERIGAGIMVGGQVLRGHAGVAGELAFLGQAEEDPDAHGISQLVRLRSGGKDPADVFAAAAAGDREALALVENAERWAGPGIVMAAQIVNPEVVVISGGVARAGETLLAPLRRRLESSVRMPPRLVASPLADRGPLLGAIRLALDELEPRLLDGLDEAPEAARPPAAARRVRRPA
jgi:predicted NBD/HSP70 family sugar kinase